MADNQKYLVPREIILNMKRIETAIRRNSFKLYRPTYIHKEKSIDNALLMKEAEVMLEFVGLKGYVPDVKFAKLDAGTAGNISLNNTFEHAVHINVSDSSRNRWESCVAILAHEICHKLLIVNNLYDTDTLKNETLVDLATIYVGFGECIIKGYTDDNKNLVMGYLHLDNYKIAEQIMLVAYGKMMPIATNLSGTDPFIDDLMEILEKNSDESKLIQNSFIANEKQRAELHYNILLLEQLTRNLKLNMRPDFARYDNLFFKTLEFKDGEIRNKMSSLSILYELLLNDSYPEPSPDSFIQRINAIINKAIYDIYQVFQTKYSFEFSYPFTCPQCGSTSPNNSKIVNHNTIMKCPQCGCHFYFMGQHYNFTVRQREIREEKRQANIEANRKIDERVEAARKDMLQAIAKASADSQRAQAAAKVEIQNIRKHEQEEYRNKVKQRVPGYLRWLIDKYL